MVGTSDQVRQGKECEEQKISVVSNESMFGQVSRKT